MLRTKIACNNQNKIEDALLSCLFSTALFCVNENVLLLHRRRHLSLSATTDCCLFHLEDVAACSSDRL